MLEQSTVYETSGRTEVLPNADNGRGLFLALRIRSTTLRAEFLKLHLIPGICWCFLPMCWLLRLAGAFLLTVLRSWQTRLLGGKVPLWIGLFEGTTPVGAKERQLLLDEASMRLRLAGGESRLPMWTLP